MTVDGVLHGRLDNGPPLPGRVPGAVVLVARGDEVVHHTAYGSAVRYTGADGTPLAAPVPARPDTVFDLASVTKLFTAALALRAVEDGQLGLDEPVALHLPGLHPRLTLRHLLTHTSGLPAVRNLWRVPGGRQAREAALLATSQAAEPGARHEYSCVGYMLAGLLLERVMGEPLNDLLGRYLTGPLGLSDTGYLPRDVSRVAATEDQSVVGRGLVHGEVHDEASWALGGTAGNAGVFGTAADLLRFAQMLRAGGTDPRTGRRVLSGESVQGMTRDQLPRGGARAAGYGQGLGPRIADRALTGSRTSAAAFGHAGFTGTSLVVDPEHDLTVILLANAVHPVRGRTDMRPLRRALADAAVSFDHVRQA